MLSKTVPNAVITYLLNGNQKYRHLPIIVMFKMHLTQIKCKQRARALSQRTHTGLMPFGSQPLTFGRFELNIAQDTCPNSVFNTNIVWLTDIQFWCWLTIFDYGEIMPKKMQKYIYYKAMSTHDSNLYLTAVDMLTLLLVDTYDMQFSITEL